MLEQKSGTRDDSRVCHWCSYHIFDVLWDHWTDARQHGIYLFYIIKKQATFQNYWKAGLWQLREKAIWRNLLSIQNEAISLVAMHNKDLTWFKQGLDSSENLQQRQNWTAKSTNVKRKCWKNQISFCHQSSLVNRKAWMLPWILLEFKENARKTCGCGQHWPAEGVLLGVFGGGVPPASPNPDPISDQKMPFSTPVFRSGLKNPYPFSDLTLKFYTRRSIINKSTTSCNK